MNKKPTRSGSDLLHVALLLLFSLPAHAEVSITLKSSFIQEYKDRATISADFIIDETKGKPNPASKDGDMHVAGRDAKNIGLPTVAEIMNAKEEPEAVKAANAAAGTGKLTAVNGAWRIWNEHGGDNTKFVQGKPVSPAKTSNPDHVFEIHPITSIEGVSTADSFKPIQGYDAKKPEDGFFRYEQVRSKIIPGNGTVTIVSNGVGYNYVDFELVLNEKPFPVNDGAFAFASIQDLQGHLLLRKKRVVFVKGTPPYEAVQGRARATASRCWGSRGSTWPPVDWRVKNRKDPRDPLNWNLPYEIIVVGVYPETCESD